MEPQTSPDLKQLNFKEGYHYWFQVFYQLSFWFIVIIVLLNVIFGIIIVCFREPRNPRCVRDALACLRHTCTYWLICC